MEYGAKPHQVKHWDTLDLGTLSRAIDKGHVQVRAWDEVPLNGAQPSQNPGFQNKLDFCTRCIRLVGRFKSYLSGLYVAADLLQMQHWEDHCLGMPTAQKLMPWSSRFRNPLN